jgi:ubiquinone/menaquinone biosynthesis C-methylase UbiE
MTTGRHWDHVYSTRSAESVSWYQSQARQSLALIESVATANARIIDVGGGASTLVDDLLRRDFGEITVLDISATALDVARERLGAAAERVVWLQADITRVALPPARFDVWHDRAVFHFLTDRASRVAYMARVKQSVRHGGHVIIAAYGTEGPAHCSGLPVSRFSAESLLSEFGAQFDLVEHLEERHRTPSGAIQHFVYCHCLMH